MGKLFEKYLGAEDLSGSVHSDWTDVMNCVSSRTHRNAVIFSVRRSSVVGIGGVLGGVGVQRLGWLPRVGLAHAEC